jgi:isopenicillin-N N-acyltransferase-like protein
MAIAAADPVVLEGDGRARGRAHGETLRDRIGDALDRWDEDAAARTGLAPAVYVERFLTATRFEAAIRRHTPALLDELAGIGEGAGVAYERILAFNLMDEEWWFSERLRGRPACSLVAVAPEGDAPGVLAQNMDLPALMDGGQITLRLHDPGGAETVVLSAAGMIGTTGANDAGVGVCVNALSMLRHDADGLPVAFVVRGLLERRSLAAAEAFVQEVPHASGQHYALGAPQGVSGWECSAAGATRSSSGGGRFWHTNHPLASDDLDPDMPPDAEAAADSRRRYDLLDDRGPGVRALDDAQDLLADRSAPLCMPVDPGRGWSTFGSLATELVPGPRVRVALGPPDRTPWSELQLTS